MEIRQDIQILRGVAVLLVVLFHLQFSFMANGFLGVDIFFVISGYLMAKLYRQGTRLDFYRRRIDRLLPAYAAVVITTTIVAAFITIPVDFWQVVEQAYASSLFMSNLHFWNQDSYFDKVAFKPLLNLWSLSVEAQFYLIVPFLFPLIEKRRLWTLFLIAASLGLCVFVQSVSPKTAFFQLPFRMYEFLLGAWVAWYQTQPPKDLKLANWFRLFWGMTLSAVLFLLHLDPISRSPVDGHPSLLAAVTALATSQLIRLGLPTFVVHSPIGRALGKLGDYSYSIYLVHFPIIVLWNYVPFNGTVLEPADTMNLVGVVLCASALSVLSYHLLERRFASHFKNNGARIALPVVVIVASLTAQYFNAAGFKLEDRNIFAAWTDRSTYRCGKLFRMLNPTDQICVVGEMQWKDSILLVGNSHADAIKTELSKAANSRSFKLTFMVGNRPLLDDNQQADSILVEARDKGIKAIVVHFNNIYGTETARRRIAAFLIRARELGFPTALIAPVPYFDVHVPQELYLIGDTTPRLIMSRKDHDDRTADFRRFAAELVDKGVFVFDPANLLCPQGEDCRFSDTSMKPYYFDETHLTLTGAEVLSPLFNELVLRIGAAHP